MFPDAELADLRSLAESAMPDTCVLYQRVDSSDGYDGAGSAVWTASGTVACRVQPANLSPEERAAAGQLLGLDRYDVHVPVGTNLGSVGRITSQGATYEVSGTVSPRSYIYDVTTRVVRITGG